MTKSSFLKKISLSKNLVSASEIVSNLQYRLSEESVRRYMRGTTFGSHAQDILDSIAICLVDKNSKIINAQLNLKHG